MSEKNPTDRTANARAARRRKALERRAVALSVEQMEVMAAELTLRGWTCSAPTDEKGPR